MNYRDYITIEPGKRSGKPCVRGLRITVSDVLDMLADEMTYQEIMEDFPELKPGRTSKPVWLTPLTGNAELIF